VIWPFAIRKSSGYPAYSYRLNGKQNNADAHRFVCELAHGIPTGGYQAAHKCGVQLCVNPSHIYWATPAQNASDAKLHGNLKGGGRYRQKIFAPELLEIRASPLSYLALGMKFGVAPSYIGKLRRKDMVLNG